MVKHYLRVFALIFLATLVTPEAFAASFTATVDRTELSAFETLELTLRTDVDTDDVPDLSSLDKDFEVISTRQNRQIRIINGQTESWQDWIVTLAPRREGRLLIPRMSLNNLTSAPITIQVSKDNSLTGDNAGPIFIRTEINKEQVYVQEEVVLSLKIFYRVNLYDESRLTPLNVDGAIVQQLGETKKYDTVVNGTRYGVFELNFAIYPQKAGSIEIPALTFTGTMAERRDPFSSIFSMGGKPVTARSAEIYLSVKPQPASFSGPVWLPARNLSLNESWSSSTSQIRVGDAITRTITLEVEGLSSAQLPAVRIPSPDGVNSYPDQSRTEDVPAENGITGRRVEAIAMVPSQPGVIQLPAIRYTWYDTENGVEKVSEISARTINVLPAEGGTQAPLTIPPPALTETTTAKTPECPPEQVSLSSPDSGSSGFWKWLSAILALLWIGTSVILWRTRKTKSPEPDATDALPSSDVSETRAFKKLEVACQTADASQIRSAFITWAQALLKDQSLTTADKCLLRLGSDSLVKLFQSMDAAMYSADKGNVPATEILNQCKALRNSKGGKSGSDALPELYPGS